jgi:hypothetical protein
MTDFGRRFDPSELEDGDPASAGDSTEAELLAIARDLEAYARSDSVTLSVDFEDRVMAAIADEPPPRPLAARGPFGIVTLVRDSWRLAWSRDRPLAVRAQALAFVLLAAVALGSLGSLAAVGVGRLLAPDAPAPSVAPAPLPTPSPSAPPGPSPSVSPPSPTPSPTPTQDTPEPTETAEATETPEAGGDSSGPGSGSGSDSAGPGSGDDRTPRPTDDSSGPGSGGDSSGSGSGD